MPASSRTEGKPAQARPLLEDAVKRQQAALKLNSGNAVYKQRLASHHLLLAQTLLDVKDYVQAASVVAELVKSAPSTWSDQQRAAACLARCAGLAEKDKNLSSADREKLVNDYADRAVALLRQAIAHGFKDADYLRRTADFEPLRCAQDFKKVAAEVAKN